MKKNDLKKIWQYVEDNIETFHNKRIAGLSNLKLDKVLQKKNPYLFKAKYLLTSESIIKSLTDAFISSQEEAIFGDWLEGLAIYINGLVYKGRKSSADGLDLEFDKDRIRYIVNIKSGPNWGNSSQISKMKADFIRAKKTLRTSNSNLNIVAVNGCCYGRDNNPDKGEYYKYCGQRFWEFISGDPNLYTEIIEPLGYKAKERNDDFTVSYSKKINIFTKEFSLKFCNANGEIDWFKLVKFNSQVNSKISNK